MSAASIYTLAAFALCLAALGAALFTLCIARRVLGEAARWLEALNEALDWADKSRADHDTTDGDVA